MKSTQKTILHSMKVWPPRDRTRKLTVDYIFETLATWSSKNTKYALLGNKEAKKVAAQRIETESYAVAHNLFEQSLDAASAVEMFADLIEQKLQQEQETGPESKEEQEVVSEPPTSVENTFFDISGGNQLIVETYEAAMELIKPLQEPENKYTKICFCNTIFELAAAEAVAPILSPLADQLTEVDLSNFVDGRKPVDEALKVTRLFSVALKDAQLRYLNLSHNPLGEIGGVTAFEELLKSQRNLEELCISVEDAKEACELLPSTQKLKILHFDNDMSQDEGAIADFLTKCPMLEEFSCSFAHVGSKGVIALANALERCPNLKKINLQGNVFGVEAGMRLSSVIPSLTNLTKINVSHLFLENKGTLALVEALKNSASSLEVLEMAGNSFTAKVAPALADLLKAKRYSITKIGLSKNKLKDLGAKTIADALTRDISRLTEVDLSNNMIRRKGVMALFRAVGDIHSFKLLNINGNFLSDEEFKVVKEMSKNSLINLLGPLEEIYAQGAEYYDDEVEEDSDHDDDGRVSSTKSSEGSRKISPRFASSPDTTQKSSPGPTTRTLKMTGLEVNSSSPKKPSIKIPKSTSPIIGACKSPRSPISEKQRASRVSELETQISQLEDALRTVKDQLVSSESCRRQAQQDAQDSRKQLSVMYSKLEESQKLLARFSSEESHGIQELSEAGDEACKSKLDAAKILHSADLDALATAVSEINQLQLKLDEKTKCEATQTEHAALAYAELHSLKETVAETLSLVETLKNQLNDSKSSESDANNLAKETLLQLETAKKTTESLKLENSKATALEVVEKSRESEFENQNEEDMVALKTEVEKLKSDLETAEKRLNKEQSRKSMEITSAYQLVEEIKFNSRIKESELEEELKTSKEDIEDLKANLMGKETELQDICEENEDLNSKMRNSLSGMREIELEEEIKIVKQDFDLLKSKLMVTETALLEKSDENEKLKLELKKLTVKSHWCTLKVNLLLG